MAGNMRYNNNNNDNSSSSSSSSSSNNKQIEYDQIEYDSMIKWAHMMQPSIWNHPRVFHVAIIGV